MKLRIKQTGDVVDAYSIDAQNVETIKVQYFTKNGVLDHFDFDSLEELNNCLEDYKPTPPYLKDEKVRKFVRDWATFNKIEIARIVRTDGNVSWYQITGRDKAMCTWIIQIHADYSETVSKDYEGSTVPIAGICGEENGE